MKNIIQITLNEKEDYLNKYNDKRISKELNDYILEECKAVELKDSIEIQINTNFEMCEKEKNNLVDMIRENYGVDISDIEILLRRLYILNTIMIFIGIIFLVIYFLSSNIPVVSEFILIIGWILIWEGINNIMYQSVKNAIKIKRRKKLTNCKIKFNTK